MRYYRYSEPTETGDQIITVSENDIAKDFYPYWEEKMIKKYGLDEYYKTYTFEHCIEDYCTIHGVTRQWGIHSKQRYKRV